MNELVERNEEEIKKMIYVARGKQIMLDRDLAKLYQSTNGTKDINKAVKRNITRFPEDFCFQLTREEYYNILRFQIGTLELKPGQYSKYLPYAFTEQGIAMLSSVLRTNIASEVSIKIMRTFIKLRHLISYNQDIYKNLTYINNKLIEYDNNFDKIFKLLENKQEKEIIFYNGQIFDAYSKIIEIFKLAKKELIVIDNYADISFLEMIKKLKVKVILITKEKSLLKEIDINKYNEEYSNLTIIKNNTFHDRFIIIDKDIVFHCGTSLNKAGGKTFAINKIEENDMKTILINNVLKKKYSLKINN